MRVLIAAALISTGAGATTLVALWTPDQVIPGADSLMLTNVPGVRGNACKIGQAGSTFFAFSGLVDDPSAGFSARAAAERAIGEKSDLNGRMEQFLALAHEPLARALDAVRHDEPDSWAWVQQGHPPLQAIFAERGSGVPSLGIATIAMMPDGTLQDSAHIIAQGDDGRGPRIIYAGQQSGIRAWLHAHPDWYNGDRAALVRRLIQLEVDESPGMVGGPFDVVSIAATGAEWLDKKTACAVLPPQP